MCGIVGAVSNGQARASISEDGARGAIAAIGHRGPDGRGEYRDGVLWFGHVRLSILDLSPAASQPMTTSDGRFVICYNGEVYNYRELAAELSISNLRSHSDTEVVLRAFALLGADAFVRLNGIFALAIYDRTRQKLWLVRDRLGVKPLYYRLDSRGLIFASEIKAILRLSDEPPQCDVSSLHEWLYYGTSLGGRTLYRGITQLLPGHYLELDVESFRSRVERYWSLEEEANRQDVVRCSPQEMIAETRRLVEEGVRRQLVSDVPVGVFLSGGVDSSAITAFASRHYAGRLATYTAGFDDRNSPDERPKARRIATRYGTDHHEIHIGGGDVADLVEKMVHHHDMPFSDAANIPLYLMAEQISGRTKVVLQGDGADELFGGYRRYTTVRYRRWIRPLAGIGQSAWRLAPPSVLRQRVLRYLRAFAAEDLSSTMARLLTVEDGSAHPASAFSPELQRHIEETDPFVRYRECQRRFAEHDVGNQMSLVDLTVLLPDTYLEKVDRATMAASLEVRVPFLDNDLVSYVVRIPGTRKMPWGRKKWLLKKALTGVVPDDVLYGAKTGFSVPFGHWLRTSLRPFFFDHLSTFDRERPGVLNPTVLREWHEETASRRHDYSYMLWKMLNFMVWCNTTKVAVAS